MPPGLRPKAIRQLPRPRPTPAEIAFAAACPLSNRSRISVRSVGKLMRRGIVWVIENS